MPATEAQILANRRNAALSTGPKTEEGKERSRQNALKHGLTGDGIVLPEADAAEVDRRSVSFARDLNASGDLGHALARRAALNSVRMERGARQETAALAERVRQIEADFVPPEGVDEAEADRLRTEAGEIALFDPSREACLARKYEAAAERGFYRAIKELRQMRKQAQAETSAPAPQKSDELMGSFLQTREIARQVEADFHAMMAERNKPLPTRPANSPQLTPMTGGIDLPISVGRRR